MTDLEHLPELGVELPMSASEAQGSSRVGDLVHARLAAVSLSPSHMVQSVNLFNQDFNQPDRD